MVSCFAGRYLRQYRTKIVRVLRSQIFRQIVQRGRGKAVALQGRIVQYDGKDASKTCTKSNKWSLCGVALNPIQSDNRRASGNRNSEFRIPNSEL